MVDANKIKCELEARMKNTYVEISGEGCGLSLMVISELFEGVSAVKRQQMVYKYISGWISSGEIHAVSMQTLTPQESHGEKS